MADEYCDIDIVKDRMLIALNDTSYDDALNTAVEEASRMIDIFLMPYEDTLPLTGDNITAQLNQIAGDFSASIFKRRMVPTEVRIRGALQPNPMDIVSSMDASGWFGIGIKKLEMYIKGKYTLATEISNTVYNPDIWVRLFDKGMITGLEARTRITDAANAAIKKIEDITKTLAVNETIVRDETLTKAENITREITETQYITKKQSSFAFIEGDKDGGYKEQEE